MRGQSGEKRFRNYRRKVMPHLYSTALLVSMAREGLLYFQAL